MRPFRMFGLVVSFLILSLIKAEAQIITPIAIPVPLQFFGGVQIKGGTGLDGNVNLVKGRFAFAQNEKAFHRIPTGLTLSLFPDGTGAATVYFGQEVTRSDYVQVRGRVVDTGVKRYFENARVTALRLNGVNVSP